MVPSRYLKAVFASLIRAAPIEKKNIITVLRDTLVFFTNASLFLVRLSSPVLPFLSFFFNPLL